MLQPALSSPRPSPFKTHPNSSRAHAEFVGRDYSLAKVLLEGPRLRGWEAEVSQELSRVFNRPPAGVFVPAEVLAKRDLVAGTPSAGGVTIQETVEPSLIPVLRNRSVVVAMGATVLEGLQGNVRFPRETVTVPPVWVAEGGGVAHGDQVFDSIVLKPKRIAGQTAFSIELLSQSIPGIEDIVRNDLIGTIAIALDEAALVGTGVTNNQPTGILNYTPNTAGGANYGERAPDVTFGAAATWPHVLDLESNVETANIPIDRATAGYVSSPATKRKWKAAPKLAGYPSFLWESGDLVNGYRALASNQLSATNQVIFSARWSDCLVGLWPSFDLVVDNFTLFDSGTVRVVVNLLADVQFRYCLSFAASTDAGNQ